MDGDVGEHRIRETNGRSIFAAQANSGTIARIRAQCHSGATSLRASGAMQPFSAREQYYGL